MHPPGVAGKVSKSGRWPREAIDAEIDWERERNLHGCTHVDPRLGHLAAGCLFLSVLRPDATEVNGFIYLAYGGAVLLIIGLRILGVGLIRKSPDVNE